MPTVERTASQATYTTSAAPASSRYATAKQRIYVGAGAQIGYVYIPVPAEIRGRTVVSATISMTSDAVWPGSRSVTIRRHENPDPTTYSRMTWNNDPGPMGSSVPVTVTQAGTVRTWSFDVTSEWAAIAAGADYFGWQLTTDDATARAFRGCDTGSAPRVTIVYSDVPAAPLGLVPAGGLYVSKQQQILTWEPRSDATHARVQFDVAGGTFAAPTWDSGWVALAQGDGTFDTAAAGWPGLADGATVSWRVAVRTDGGDSAFSAPVTFGRKVKPSLSITSPAAEPTGTGDPTPYTQWVPGGPQSRWQVVRRKPDGAVWASTPVTPGAETSALLEKGPTVDGERATDVVRVWWDDVPRVSTPGDEAFSAVAVDWVVDMSAALAGPDAINSWQLGGKLPRVALQWNRSAGAPDEWMVLRQVDGRDWERLDRFTADQHTAGVDGWRWDDRSIPPNLRVVYAVVPGVGGQFASLADMRRTSITIPLQGVWIFDPSDDSKVVILGDDCLSMSPGETSVVYQPPGNPKPIKRTTILKGRTGTISEGYLSERNPLGLSVAEMTGTLEEFRRRTLAELRLASGFLNIPVILRNVDPGRVDYATSFGTRIRTRVNLEAYQCGEFDEMEPEP